MIIKPRIRGFICTTAHPVGCAANVNAQIEYVRAQGLMEGGPRNVFPSQRGDEIVLQWLRRWTGVMRHRCLVGQRHHFHHTRVCDEILGCCDRRE